jgi:hypothetical protein
MSINVLPIVGIYGLETPKIPNPSTLRHIKMGPNHMGPGDPLVGIDIPRKKEAQTISALVAVYLNKA